MTANETDLRGRLLEAATLVGTAKTLLAQGNVVELAGLEGRVARICAEIPGLPPAERDGLKPALIALMDGLGGLAEALKAQHQELAARLAGVAKGHRALAAYGAGEAAGRKPRKR